MANIRQIGVYFGEAGVFVFGSGLAIVPFLRGGVVGQFHWLNDRQFLDAVAVAMIGRVSALLSLRHPARPAVPARSRGSCAECVRTVRGDQGLSGTVAGANEGVAGRRRLARALLTRMRAMGSM